MYMLYLNYFLLVFSLLVPFYMPSCFLHIPIPQISLILCSSCYSFCNLSIGFDEFNLSLHSDMASVAKAMASPESGLEVRDRMWLKITIPNAFLGKNWF